MNKSGNLNRSVRNTKRKLREALLTLMKDKPINKISATELTQLADVNRGTFYFHYSDVYDMLYKIEDEFFEKFECVLNTDVGKEKGLSLYLTAIFTFFGENQDMCRILLGANSDMVFLERLKKLVDEKCSYFWSRRTKKKDKERLSMYNAFIINGCIGIIKKWLDDDLAESVEDISALVATVINASVNPLL